MFPGSKGGLCIGMTTLLSLWADCPKSGSLNLLESVQELLCLCVSKLNVRLGLELTFCHIQRKGKGKYISKGAEDLSIEGRIIFI